MNTMNDYSIYCTPEQTQKAFELGAPLYKLYGSSLSDYVNMLKISDSESYIIPTAEEMIGWLDTKEVLIDIGYSDGFGWSYYLEKTSCDEVGGFDSRKEVTLAAIDTALKYLQQRREV